MKNGFTMISGNKELFLISEKKNITTQIVNAFISKVCELKNKSPEFEAIALHDDSVLKRFKFRINKATLSEEKTFDGLEYYHIEGKGFIINTPKSDNSIVIF